jgi:non-heme chloroperoxidase
MDLMQHGTVELDGVRLHYAEVPRARPPLVLLHGITDSHVSYLPLMPELAEDWRVYALDLRGHGQSGHVSGAYRVRDYAGDLQVFLRSIVAEPAVLVGHSLGGLVAACAAGESGARLRGLFLEDPPIYTASMPAIKGTSTYAIFVTWRNILTDHAQSGASADDLVKQITDTVSAERLHTRAEQLHQLDPQVLDAVVEGSLFEGFNPDEVLPRISCPTRLLAAQYDLGGTMTEADVMRVVSTIPDCAYTILKNVSHDIHQEWPHDYMRELRGFLNLLNKDLSV